MPCFFNRIQLLGGPALQSEEKRENKDACCCKDTI